MSDPSVQSFQKLKRLIRYLKGEKQWSQVFEFGNMSSEATVLSDADWVGDRETRKSSSAGDDTFWKRTREGRRLLPEALPRQNCTAEEFESMMIYQVFAVEPVLIIDAKATEHILHRHGIGRVKNIDVAHLWLQGEVK